MINKLKIYSNLFRNLIRIVFLNIAYFLGIGLTAFICKTIGANLNQKDKNNTSWNINSNSEMLTKMY
jgi:hypothetical protein